MTPGSLVAWLDLAGVVVFAVAGALTASRKQLDVVGFMLVATLTGIGGGTLRDLLLQRPVFWLDAPHYLLLTCSAAVLVFFTAHRVESRYRVLLWADAVGMALYCVMGAEIAAEAGAGPPVAALMGVMTATFGGLLRDVVCDEIPLILRREIYATAAAAGAAAHLALTKGLGAPVPLAAALGFATALGIRAAALAFDLTVPVYRHRPGRDYPPGRGP